MPPVLEGWQATRSDYDGEVILGDPWYGTANIYAYAYSVTVLEPPKPVFPTDPGFYRGESWLRV